MACYFQTCVEKGEGLRSEFSRVGVGGGHTTFLDHYRALGQVAREVVECLSGCF